MYEIHKNNAFYNKKDVALFNVNGGNQIEIYPHNCKDRNLIFDALLNFPLALIFYQRGFSIIHASSVEYKGKVILFCGQSHSGKSTISNLISNNGGSLISDDISVLKKNGKRYQILPSHQLQKLSSEFVEKIKPFNINNKKILTSRDRLIYTNNSFNDSEKNIDICFFINRGDNHAINMISNKELINNLLKFSYITEDKLDYLNILDIADNIQFFKLTLKEDIENLLGFVEYFNNWFSNKNNHQI